MPNYNTLWGARDWVGMRGSGGRGGGGGGVGGGGGKGSGTHRKITRDMGRSRSKPPPAPGEISWFAHGGGGGQFISLECIRTDCLMRPSQRFWGTGEEGIYTRGRGIGEQRPNFEGNRGTNTIFDFWGTGEQAYLFQGNRYPPPPPPPPATPPPTIVLARAL